MHTQGYLTQSKSNTDLEIFVSALDSAVLSGTAPSKIAMGAFGLAALAIPVNTTNIILGLACPNLLFRTGMYAQTALQSLSGQAFGTSNGPGPNSISGTSGPFGFGPLQTPPPVTGANLPTLKGSVSGPPPKGIQVNWVDYLYQVGTIAATSIQAVIAKINIPLPGNDILQVNSALSATATLDPTLNSGVNRCHRVRVPITTPAFITDDAAVLVAELVATTPGTGTINWAGVILGCSYNFN